MSALLCAVQHTTGHLFQLKVHSSYPISWEKYWLKNEQLKHIQHGKKVGINQIFKDFYGPSTMWACTFA